MRKVVLVAVDIRSTHNIGAFFRTADGFSCDVMLVGETTPRPKGDEHDNRLPHISEKAHTAIHKTALGAEESVSWSYIADQYEALETLRSSGYKIYAVEQDKSSRPLQQLPADEPIALLMGPEVTGLDKKILALCDGIYEIPMSGEKESFNVSVAAGIALYQSRLK
jgi:tRNA G18 (ribose-2'-O)-methylase SpoU